LKGVVGDKCKSHDRTRRIRRSLFNTAAMASNQAPTIGRSNFEFQ
jgi:hypothetical protein